MQILAGSSIKELSFWNCFHQIQQTWIHSILRKSLKTFFFKKCSESYRKSKKKPILIKTYEMVICKGQNIKWALEAFIFFSSKRDWKCLCGVGLWYTYIAWVSVSLTRFESFTLYLISLSQKITCYTCSYITHLAKT